MEVMNISDIPAIRLGNAQDLTAATGCTVILCPEGATAGVDVRGGAPGTRETDLLKPENLVEKIHGLLLAGGSAYGLAAASGVMSYLEENSFGFDVGVARVPIVPAAVLFDLPCGDARVRPDQAMGYQACQNSETERFATGSVGAGTGATVGKVYGMDKAMKGGLGAHCVRIGGLVVGAVVAVNCLGDVIDPASGQIVAGAVQQDPFRFLDSEAGLLQQCEATGNRFTGNTTIGAIITNGDFNKAELTKIASMTRNAYARCINPVGTLADGDTIYAASCGQVKADLNMAGTLAADVMAEAIRRAIENSKMPDGDYLAACRKLGK